MKKLELILPIRITPTTKHGGSFVIKDARGVGYSFYEQKRTTELNVIKPPTKTGFKKRGLL